jgi:hypothetical protein
MTSLNQDADTKDSVDVSAVPASVLQPTISNAPLPELDQKTVGDLTTGDDTSSGGLNRAALDEALGPLPTQKPARDALNEALGPPPSAFQNTLSVLGMVAHPFDPDNGARLQSFEENTAVGRVLARMGSEGAKGWQDEDLAPIVQANPWLKDAQSADAETANSFQAQYVAAPLLTVLRAQSAVRNVVASGLSQLGGESEGAIDHFVNAFSASFSGVGDANQRGMLYFKIRDNSATPDERAHYEQIKAQMDAEKPPEGFMGTAGDMVGGMAGAIWSGYSSESAVTAGVAGAGIGAVIVGAGATAAGPEATPLGIAAGAWAGAKLGATAGAMTEAFEAGVGRRLEKFDALRDANGKTIPTWSKWGAAMVGGAVDAYLMKLIPNIAGKEIDAVIEKGLADEATQTGLGMFAWNTAKASAHSAAIGGGLAALNAGGEEFGKGVANIFNDANFATVMNDKDQRDAVVDQVVGETLKWAAFGGFTHLGVQAVGAAGNAALGAVMRRLNTEDMAARAKTLDEARARYDAQNATQLVDPGYVVNKGNIVSQAEELGVLRGEGEYNGTTPMGRQDPTVQRANETDIAAADPTPLSVARQMKPGLFDAHDDAVTQARDTQARLNELRSRVAEPLQAEHDAALKDVEDRIAAKQAEADAAAKGADTEALSAHQSKLGELVAARDALIDGHAAALKDAQDKITAKEVEAQGAVKAGNDAQAEKHQATTAALEAARDKLKADHTAALKAVEETAASKEAEARAAAKATVDAQEKAHKDALAPLKAARDTLAELQAKALKAAKDKVAAKEAEAKAPYFFSSEKYRTDLGALKDRVAELTAAHDKALKAADAKIAAREAKAPVKSDELPKAQQGAIDRAKAAVSALKEKQAATLKVAEDKIAAHKDAAPVESTELSKKHQGELARLNAAVEKLKEKHAAALKAIEDKIAAHEAVAPKGADIAKAHQRELAKLEAERKKLEDAHAAKIEKHPAVARAKADLAEIEKKRGELEPHVRDALKTAEAALPPKEAAEQPTAAEPVAEPPRAAPKLSWADQGKAIAEDFYRQAMLARGPDVPEQSVRDAALVQALYYQTLAHVNGGRLGDPMHLYLSRGMEVRKAGARGTTLAQSLAQAVHVPADTEVTKGRDGFELMQQSAGRRLGYDATQTKETMDVIEKIGNGENVPGVSAEQHAEITRLVNDARRQGHLPAEGDGEPGADGTTGSAAEPGADTGLEQKRRGEIFVPGAYRNNLRSIVRMMQTSNASTLMHEMSHDWLHWLMHDAQQEGSPQQVKDDAALLMKWLHVKGAVLPDANGAFSPTNKRAHEQFATGFEQYLREGRAPSRALEGVFSRFKDWLTTIYKTVRDMGQFAVPISDDVRGVFDRLLSYDGHEPAVIEPKDHRAATIHDIHEADAQAHPSVAHETAEAIRREADAVAAEHDQEVHDEITNRGGTEGAADGQPVAGKEAGGNEPTGEPAREGVAASSAVEVGKGGTGASGEGAKPSPEPVKPAPAPVSAKVEAAEPKPEPEPAQSPATRAKPVEPVAVPEAPNAPFKEEPRFLDKAGNVRLDNVQSSEDFKELAREWAQEHGDEQMVRRGELTDAELLGIVNSLGVDPRTFKPNNPDNLPWPVYAAVVQKVAWQAIADLKTAAKALDQEQSKANAEAYEVAKARRDMVWAEFSDITYAAGRTLRTMIRPKEDIETYMDRFRKTMTPDALAQSLIEARLACDIEDPSSLAKFMQSMRVEPTFRDYVVEYYIHNLISGPITHMGYAFHNIGLIGWKLPETFVSEVLRDGGVKNIADVQKWINAAKVTGDAARGMLGADTRVQAWAGVKTAWALNIVPFLPGEQIALQSRAEELAYKSYDAGKQPSLKAFQAAYAATTNSLVRPGMITGENIARSIANSFGKDISQGAQDKIDAAANVFRAPVKMIQAIHTATEAMSYGQEMAILARRDAIDKGLTGAAADTAVKQFLANPPDEAMAHARDEARKMALMRQSEYGGGVGALKTISNSSLPAKIAMPFVQIVANILHEGLVERSAVGLFSKSIRDNLRGVNGKEAQATQWARLTLGTGITVGVMSLAARGVITGAGPENPNERRQWLEDHQPYSVKIGGYWVPYRGGSLGTLMGVSADIFEIYQHAPEDDLGKLLGSLLGGVEKAVINESMFRGLKDILNLSEHSDTSVGSFSRNLAGNFVPWSVGLGQVSQMVDPYFRESRTMADVLLKKIPGYSAGFYGNEPMLAKRDIWGEPIQSHISFPVAGVARAAFGAQWEKPSTPDPLNSEMERLGIFPSAVPRKIRGVDITDEQYDAFARDAGQLARQRLLPIVTSPGWGAMPDYAKDRLIRKIMAGSRAQAANATIIGSMGTANDIMKSATKAKLSALNGD